MTLTTHRSTASRTGGVIAALGFCFGIPALLGRAAGWPLPRRLPAVSAVGDALTGGWRPDDHVVISVLALVGWVVWAQIAVCTAAEIRAARSGRVGRALPFSAWCRPIAVRLAAALVVVAPFTPRVAGAAPAPTFVPAVVTVAVAPRVLPVGGEAAPAVNPSTAEATTVHVVCPGDTLWDLAEGHLGDPLRWRELFDTNRNTIQPDGSHLDDPGLLRPGWRIVLPIAPAPPAATSESVSAAPAPEESIAENTPVSGTATPSDPAPPAAAAPDHGAPTTAAPAPGADTPAEDPKQQGGPSTTTSLAQVGLPSLTAGVLLGYLGALRKDRERRRRRHHRFPKSTPAQMVAERNVRAVARPDAPAWVDLALRHLAASLQTEGAPPPPAVLGVRAGDLGLEVLISPPWPVAPGRFLPVDDGHTWRLDPAVELEELTALTADLPAYVPAIVTVGDTDSGAVLIDLDEAGTLVVEGAVDQVDAVLMAMATELASASWSENCDVCLVGLGNRLGELDRVRILDADHAVAELRRAAGMPGTGGLADGARGDIPAAPTIALVGPGALEADDLRALLAVAQPHSGLTVVAAGGGTGGRVRLVSCPDGTGILYPLGLTVQLATGAAAADELVDLLAATAARGTDLPLDAASTADTSSVEVCRSGGSAGTDDADEQAGEDPVDTSASAEPEPTAEPVVAVQVLGPVEINWQGPNPRPQIAEFVSYLAAHPRGVTSDQARLALWPVNENDDRFGERSPATLWSLTTKARRSLGQDRDGNALILREANNSLRLSSAVTCDWIEFERLTKAARSDRGRAPELLRQALSMVRGRPFEGAAWAWVDVERLDGAIEVAIADAAGELADLALGTSDLDTARFAVNQGLRAVPQAEALLRSAMRVAAAGGDRSGVERAWRDARRLGTVIDSLGQPEPETVALYESLRQPKGDA